VDSGSTLMFRFASLTAQLRVLRGDFNVTIIVR
jgi:hypothetical protein